MTSSPHFRANILFLSCAALFLFLHLFRLPFTPILFEGDHSVHLSNAWRMFSGEVPFRDFFLITFPGTEFYYLTLYGLFGVHQWLLNVTIFCLLMSLSALGLFFSRRLLTGWAIYLPVSLFLVIGVRPLGIDGSHRFFGVLAALIAVAIVFPGRTFFRLGLAGFFCGVASSFTQQRGLLAITAIVVFLFVEKSYLKQNFSTFFKSVLCVAAPFVLVIAFILIYFISTAGYENFYYATFVFPVKNYPADDWNNFNAYLKEIPNFGALPFLDYLKQAVPILFFYALIPLVYIVFAIVLWFKRRLIDDEKKLQLIFINLVGLFLAVGVFSARFYQGSILALISLIWIIQVLLPNQKIINALLLLIALLGISYSVQRQITPVYYLDTPSGAVAFLAPENLIRYRWAAEHTQPFEYLFEPQHPSLYSVFKLKNPTPMGLIRGNNYTTPEQVKSILDGLQRNPPRYIIWNTLWDELSVRESPDFHLQPLIDFLKSEYHFSEKLNVFKDTKGKTEYSVEVWERNQ